MWLIKEANDELTIKGLPLGMWSLSLVAFIIGFFIIRFYVESVGGLSQIRQLFSDNSTIFKTVVTLLFAPVCGLIIFRYSPFIITQINRRNRTLRYTKIGLFGKRVSEYNFESLDGGVRVKAEEDEHKNEELNLYFKIKSGAKLDMCSDPSVFWKGRAYDVAMKANEYLQTRK